VREREREGERGREREREGERVREMYREGYRGEWDGVDER
jgi:hypothetical protein